MKLKPRIIMNGIVSDEWEFKAIVACKEEGILEIILYKKEPLDEPTSND